MSFRTFWNQAEFKRPLEEVMSKELITETAGYVPPEIRIKEMIQSGRNLMAFRAEAYDFGSEKEVPDDYYDPTRAHGYDQDDAHRDLARGAKAIHDYQEYEEKKKEAGENAPADVPEPDGEGKENPGGK